MSELRSVLATGLAGRGFSLAAIAAASQEPLPPFDPGTLGVPIQMPDQNRYLVPPLTGAQAYDPIARRHWDAQAAQARGRFEHDWHAAWGAEQQRQRQLADYRVQYDTWALERGRQLAWQSTQAAELAERVRAGEVDAVVGLFEAVLNWREDWPNGFPIRCEVSWDASTNRLVVQWLLPPYDVVPALSKYRYVRSADREDEVTRPATQRREIYRETLAQCALRVIAEVFRADAERLISVVGLNGFAIVPDPATGQDREHCLVAVEVDRATFQSLALDRVEPLDCLLHALSGQLSARPEKAEPVSARPAATTFSTSGDEPDLFTMDPLEFEKLIAELFRRRGFRTSTTDRSGDEGVDVLAEDPDPITGGKIVIQAKRYRHTVSPSAVRDLESTMRHQGANRGILVTTSRFGPGSRKHAQGKPLTLVDGSMLIELLREHGLPGRLGPASVEMPRQRAAEPPTPLSELKPGQNAVLPAGEVRVRFRSGGAEADLTLLLLDAGGKVRRDEDFVFYHQPTAEDGAVTLRPADRSATVLTGRLPDAVRRVAISVNLDTDGDATCADLVDPAVELSAGPAAWVFRPPADPAISAMLVAELYRHPADGWKLRAVGQGWSDGLAGLARDHGVDVA
ncbi:restriction endonuclease [Kitasatospora sp. NPDC088134]|uniref:restriction endonuclease n=1 Tax=Kitasatospora sp. NPDC088134 TaxID=3364071 RepID=UPI00382BA51C